MDDSLTVSGGTLTPLSDTERRLYIEDATDVFHALAHCPAYRHSPLRHIDAASTLDIDRLWVKDESQRFGVDSFKSLGGAYAVLKLAAARSQIPLSSLTDLERLRSASRDFVVCAATDGNHGRAVAVGARLIGARCVIFVHEHVSESRCNILRAAGAELEVIPGHYDDAVEACRSAASRNGWQLVADFSGASEAPDVPRSVAHGYLAIAHEVRQQLAGEVPTHVLLQAGVGGLAASQVAAMADFGWCETRVVIVEPENAACLRLAAQTGGPKKLAGDIESVMGMLSCGEASAAAWPVLENRVFAYLTLPDGAALPACRWLQENTGKDPLLAGPSGGAGIAGLLHIAAQPDLRSAIGLDQNSRVLTLATEGDIDGFLTQENVRR